MTTIQKTICSFNTKSMTSNQVTPIHDSENSLLTRALFETVNTNLRLNDEILDLLVIKAHIPIGDSNSKLAHTRASTREVLLEECLTEQCSSFKLAFKHVSQPLLIGVDSQASSTEGKNVILTSFYQKKMLLFCLLPALWKLIRIEKIFGPPHDKTNIGTYALIRVFAVRSVGS